MLAMQAAIIPISVGWRYGIQELQSSGEFRGGRSWRRFSSPLGSSAVERSGNLRTAIRIPGRGTARVGLPSGLGILNYRLLLPEHECGDDRLHGNRRLAA